MSTLHVLTVFRLILLFGLQLACASSSYLNFEELDSVLYSIEITGDPILIREDADETKSRHPSLRMVNKFGQNYQCLFPQLDPSLDAGDGGDEEHLHRLEDLKSLLEPLKTDVCSIKTKDWWTYELCFGRAIRQYHMEDGKPSGVIMTLGVYFSDFDWSATDQEKDNLPKHHSQFYTNGTKCDLTGQARKTEVRYVCDPTVSFETILRVDEPQSCEYIITVATNKICSIPHFRPAPSKKPKTISCSPLLTQEEYTRYEQYQSDAAKAALIKAEESKAKQREHLMKLLDGEDLTYIDTESDEGLAALEGMVGDKMAEKLVKELGNMLSAKSSGGHSLITADDLMKDKEKTDLEKDTEADIEDERDSEGANDTEGESDSNADTDDENDPDDDVDLDDEEGDAIISRLRKEFAAENSDIKDLEDEIAAIKDMGLKRDGKHSVKKELREEDYYDVDEEETKSKISLILPEDDSPKGTIDSETEGLNSGEEKLARSEEDEELENEIKKLTASQKETWKKWKGEVKKEVEKSMEKMLEETQGEMNVKLDGLEKHFAFEELTKTLENLEEKLDKAEADIKRVNHEINKAQGVFDSELDLKRDGKKSVKKELREDFEDVAGDEPEDKGIEKDYGDKLKVRVTNMSPKEAAVRALEDSPTESRVVKRLESMIKEKLTKSGLDTGGRQIEVKLVTTTMPFGNVDNEDLDGDEAQQFQHMVYNLMVGNQEAYEDIDQQRRTEKNYKFAWDKPKVTMEKTDVPIEESTVATDNKDENVEPMKIDDEL